uniref:Flocculation protein FLO11-like n=1 Tax=Rhabditophanes sp. KR3021 TaxID=114890 RepID=A0AC35TXG5_9BILA
MSCCCNPTLVDRVPSFLPRILLKGLQRWLKCCPDESFTFTTFSKETIFKAEHVVESVAEAMKEEMLIVEEAMAREDERAHHLFETMVGIPVALPLFNSILVGLIILIIFLIFCRQGLVLPYTWSQPTLVVPKKKQSSGDYSSTESTQDDNEVKSKKEKLSKRVLVQAAMTEEGKANLIYFGLPENAYSDPTLPPSNITNVVASNDIQSSSNRSNNVGPPKITHVMPFNMPPTAPSIKDVVSEPNARSKGHTTSNSVPPKNVIGNIKSDLDFFGFSIPTLPKKLPEFLDIHLHNEGSLCDMGTNQKKIDDYLKMKVLVVPEVHSQIESSSLRSDGFKIKSGLPASAKISPDEEVNQKIVTSMSVESGMPAPLIPVVTELPIIEFPNDGEEPVKQTLATVASSTKEPPSKSDSDDVANLMNKLTKPRPVSLRLGLINTLPDNPPPPIEVTPPSVAFVSTEPPSNAQYITKLGNPQESVLMAPTVPKKDEPACDINDVKLPGVGAFTNLLPRPFSKKVESEGLKMDFNTPVLLQNKAAFQQNSSTKSSTNDSFRGDAVPQKTEIGCAKKPLTVFEEFTQ